MSSAARPFTERLTKLHDLAKSGPVVRWATVTQASPLRIRMDGDADPMPITPQSAVTGLQVGQRVVCVEQHRRVIVIAARGSGMPKSVENLGPSTSTVTSTEWVPVTGMPTITFGVLPASLEVEMRFSAIVGTTTAAAYTMIGAACSGQLTLDPDIRQEDGQQSYHLTPFSNHPDSGSTLHMPISGWKRVIVPAGPETRFRLAARRSSASGTQRVNYGRLEVVPIRWA